MLGAVMLPEYQNVRQRQALLLDRLFRVDKGGGSSDRGGNFLPRCFVALTAVLSCRLPWQGLHMGTW
jgi:hypothetical protein